jgi:MFS family permease
MKLAAMNDTLRRVLRWGAFALVFAVLSSLVLTQFSATTEQRGSASKDQPPSLPAEAAAAITTITGVAISPLLGVSLVGSYQYLRAEDKSNLPWYAHPWFWLPALLVCAMVATKDFFGAVLPPGWKLPFDIAEEIENKVSGIVMAGAFVPFMASVFGSSGSNMLDAGAVLGFEWISLLNIFTVPFAIAAFLVVWLCGHMINVLILISPWGGVDAALKAFRTSLMGTLFLVGWLNPWVGAVLSLIVILICAIFAGWAFRLMVVGTVFSWDFVTLRRHRFAPNEKANWMFTARRIEKTPIRSYGKLLRGEDGKLKFEYRPWLFFPKRTVTFPDGNYAVGRGLFYPEILMRMSEKKRRAMFLLPPRYKSHEEELAKIYALAGVEDVGILKGFKAVWRWLKSLLGLGSRKEAAA